MIFEIAEGNMSWMTFLVLSPIWLKHLRNNLGAENEWRRMLIYLSPFSFLLVFGITPVLSCEAFICFSRQPNGNDINAGYSKKSFFSHYPTKGSRLTNACDIF